MVYTGRRETSKTSTLWGLGVDSTCRRSANTLGDRMRSTSTSSSSTPQPINPSTPQPTDLQSLNPLRCPMTLQGVVPVRAQQRPSAKPSDPRPTPPPQPINPSTNKPSTLSGVWVDDTCTRSAKTLGERMRSTATSPSSASNATPGSVCVPVKLPGRIDLRLWL